MAQQKPYLQSAESCAVAPGLRPAPTGSEEHTLEMRDVQREEKGYTARALNFNCWN